MAKQKLQARSKEDPENMHYMCIACRRVYSKQRSNFQTVQSRMYRGNNNYLPWCNKCVDEFFERLKSERGLSDEEATRRLCSKFDIYWRKSLFGDLPTKIPATSSIPRQYIRKTNLNHYAGLTFDDTLEEEAKERLAQAHAALVDADGKIASDTPEIPQELIQRWGPGRPDESYFDLQRRYNELTDGRPLEPATDLLVKQACLSAYEIDQLQKEGKPFEKQQSSLVNILGSLNLKPSQIKADERDAGLDNMPLGVGIQRWEQTRPIPEVSDDWKDVDKIHENYIWFMGGLTKMVGAESKYDEEYEQEVEKYDVTRPDYFDDDGGDAE